MSKIVLFNKFLESKEIFYYDKNFLLFHYLNILNSKRLILFDKEEIFWTYDYLLQAAFYLYGYIKPSNEYDLYPYTKSIFHKMSEKIKESENLGFPNLGNTCYFNSILQCFKRFFHYGIFIRSNLFDIPFVRKLFKICVLTNDKKELREFVNLFNSKNFNVYSQQDASEIYFFIVDKIFNETDLENKPFLENIFDFKCDIKYKCTICDNSHDIRTEIFRYIPIIRKDDNQSSLNSQLYNFFEETSEFSCDNCLRGKKVYIKIPKSTPDVIVLFLYVFQIKNKIAGKPINLVEYNDKMIINGVTYFLFSAVLHSGTLTGGHYITKTFVKEDDKLYDIINYNDNTVTKTKTENMFDDNDIFTPYLLFYTKKEKVI